MEEGVRKQRAWMSSPWTSTGNGNHIVLLNITYDISSLSIQYDSLEISEFKYCRKWVQRPSKPKNDTYSIHTHEYEYFWTPFLTFSRCRCKIFPMVGQKMSPATLKTYKAISMMNFSKILSAAYPLANLSGITLCKLKSKYYQNRVQRPLKI